MSIEALSFEQTNMVVGGNGTSADNPRFSSPPAGFVATGFFECNGGVRTQIYINPETFETVCVFDSFGCSGGPHIGF